MTGFSNAVIPAVIEAYDFSGIGTLVDIAGGHGAVLSVDPAEDPAMKGVLFDLDHVIAGAKPRIAAQGLADRVTTASGDFFKAVPSGGDAYIMKHIIHDWDDDEGGLILKNIRAVLPKDRPRDSDRSGDSPTATSRLRQDPRSRDAGDAGRQGAHRSGVPRAV